MCGIVGLVGEGPNDIVKVVTALTNVNNRGEESVGINATNSRSPKGLLSFRHYGKVREACIDDRATFRAFVANCRDYDADTYIGHTRYSTVGRSDVELSQPIRAIHPEWGEFSIAHNGQIVNHKQLREQCVAKGHRFRTESDSETLTAWIAQLDYPTLPQAIEHVVREIPGAYSLLALDSRHMVAARDRFGIRPLWWEGSNECISFGSEYSSLVQKDNLGKEVVPGSIVVADLSSRQVTIKQVVDPIRKHCIFEYLYFSKPSQPMVEGDGNSIAGLFRRQLGIRLAKECPVDADIVAHVPSSGFDAGWGYAKGSKIPYCPNAIERNFYSLSDKTFILPGQKNRENAVAGKYTMTLAVKGKRVVIVDDTIVRVTTAPILTRMLRRAGATEIHWRIAASPVISPCYCGIDIPTYAELPASRMSEEEIARMVGADSLRYLSYGTMMQEALKTLPGVCAGCFDGKYPIQFAV